MELKGKLAVVTGGTAGIGLAITHALHSAGAQVLVIGRNKEALEGLRYKGFQTMSADIAQESERLRVLEHIAAGSVPVDIFINNAGTMTPIGLDKPGAQMAFTRELELDLNAPVHFSLALLPALMRRSEAAIVNVTTGLVYAPAFNSPGYSAAKNGLHAFTQSLRWQVKGSGLRIMEVLPPLVDTAMVKHISGPKAQPDTVGKAVVEGLRKGTEEVRVGQTKALYIMSRLAPGLASSLINKSATAKQS